MSPLPCVQMTSSGEAVDHLLKCETLTWALGHGPKTPGGAWSRLGLVLHEGHGDLAPFFPMSLSTSRGHVALLQAGSVLPHAGRGLSTVTMWLERCASSGLMVIRVGPNILHNRREVQLCLVARRPINCR